jgi:DNA-binding FadR family transcriptional regulator
MDRYAQTLASLRHMIGRWGHRDGGRVPPERTLAEQLGVGRRLLRRALAALEEEGLLARRQGRGTFVVQAPQSTARGDTGPLPDPNWFAQCANPVELIELRLILEPIMARMAALHASQRSVLQLRRLAAQTRSATNHEDYQAADTAFHRMVAELSHNSLFLIFYDAFSGALRDEALARFGENGHCFKRQAVHVGFHESIVDAIASRDGERAERLMQDHLCDVHQSLLVDAVPSRYRPLRAVEAAE